MIAKVALLLAAFAVIDAAVLSPGLWNAGLLTPGAVSTSSVVAIPGAVSTDSRIVGTGLYGSPLLLNSGLIGTPLGLSSGLIGAPLGLNSGILAPGLILKK